MSTGRLISGTSCNLHASGKLAQGLVEIIHLSQYTDKSNDDEDIGGRM